MRRQGEFYSGTQRCPAAIRLLCSPWEWQSREVGECELVADTPL
jgi:hypothetical protein